MSKYITIILVVSILLTYKGVAFSDPDICSSVQTEENFQQYLTVAEHFNDAKFIDSKCNSSNNQLKVVCNLMIYLATKKVKPDYFLSKVPLQEDKISMLWCWDMFLFRKLGDKSTDLFQGGFATSYINEIANLLSAKSKSPLNKMLILLNYADGEYAELIADKLFNFFMQHPEVIYAQWPTISNNRSAFIRILELYSEDLPGLSRKLNNICIDKNDKRCKEITTALRDATLNP